MKAEREKIHAKVKADTVRLNGSKLELTADEEMGTFLLVSEGSCTLQMGENSLLVNPGSALLLGAGNAVLSAAGAAVPELVGCRFPLSALHELRSATQRDFARLFLPGEATVLYGPVPWVRRLRTLLEMSNLRQVARNERIQLAPMIEEIFTDLAPLSDKLGVTLTAEGDGIMTGSDALIYRLIFNLAENAVKYNRPGGSVRVSVTQEPEKLLLRVSDTGCGIPEEYQHSIFQPFFRVDKSRSREYGGAGLGLSLVWEIAGLHGGSVWVEESSEKGTTIAVELPVQ